MGLMNRMVQLGYREVVRDGRSVFVRPSKPKRRKKVDFMSDFRKRQKRVHDGEVVDPIVVDEQFESALPAVFEYMTSLPPDAPKNAKTASLTVFCEEGVFKACLNDRVDGLVCFATADTFDALLSALESMVASGEADWRRPKRGR